MGSKWFILFLVLVVSGCATGQKNLTKNYLETRVQTLEESIEEKDSEIASLKAEIDSLSRSTPTSREEGNVVYRQTAPVTASEQKTGIIRVNVSTEEIQKALKNAGFYEGEIDGKIGRRTKGAISDFQKAHDLKADGIVGQQTWNQLQTYLDG